MFEPGEDLLALTPDNYSVGYTGSRLTIQAWDRTRNIVRRVLRVSKTERARLELAVERFGRKEGPLFLVDLAGRYGADATLRSSRLVFREAYRMFLRRQFPEWTLAELTTEADLEHSLSPAFPRAFLRSGQHGWAAIGCPPDGDGASVLAFGLIWLDYLRRREKKVTIGGLAIHVPEGKQRTTALRLPWLNPSAGRFELFAYSEENWVAPVDPRDFGNLDTRLEPRRRSVLSAPGLAEHVAELPGVATVHGRDGRRSFRLHGLEFADEADGQLRFGLAHRHAAGERDLREIERLVAEIARVRSPEADDRAHPLYRQAPEAWLESEVRADPEAIDASLLSEPIYGQTPVFAGGERGVIDLLVVDRAGRLAVLELKASADLHLPLQALDYWLHVRWHLERGEFAQAGYFPGVSLRRDAPRLILVSPSLEFHPTTETLLGFLSPEIDVVRIGLAVEWRRELRTMFRLTGAQRPAPIE